jgi:hypothetical protein
MVRPFFALFVRPAALTLVWLIAMALFGAAAHLGDQGFSLAFLGHPDQPIDVDALVATTSQLVLHGSALVSVVIGLYAVLQASEMDASPRLALAPGFRDSMRAGTLVLMYALPVLVWMWAHRWADAASIQLAMLWVPWWFALGSWGTLLSRGPGLLQAVPIAAIAILALQPRLYVGVVDLVGVPGSVVSLVLATLAVVSSWRPRVREAWTLRRTDGTSLSALLDWFTDRSTEDEERESDSTRTRWWWLQQLRRERVGARNAEGRRIAAAVVTAIGFYVLGVSPMLLGLSFMNVGRVASRPLMYPLSRRDRATLQFFDQLLDVLTIGLVTWLVFTACTTIGVPILMQSGMMGKAPWSFHILGATAFAPFAQWMRARNPDVDYKVEQRRAPTLLRDASISMLLFMFAGQIVTLLVWKGFGQRPADATLTLGAIGVAMQVCCYIGLQWYFGRTDLAPAGL